MPIRDDDDERPRWREAEEDDDEPRDWEEVEPEQEAPERKGGVLGGTAPVARIVFAVILLALLATTALALRGGLQRWFGD